jgi:hypothetical protein
VGFSGESALPPIDQGNKTTRVKDIHCKHCQRTVEVKKMSELKGNFGFIGM